ncbi:MAG: hypothetical protein Q4A01_07065 [Coriobacteriales bacterium]|nr:hypothetical protein [Coriobacteriales bacterium]
MVDNAPAKTNEDLGDTGRLRRLDVQDAAVPAQSAMPEPERDSGEVEVTQAQATQAPGRPAEVETTQAQAPGQDAEEFREVPKAVRHSGSRTVLTIVFAAVACAIVGGIAAAILLLPGYGGAPTTPASTIESESEASGRATMFADVTIPVSVPELDDTGSRIPMRVEGQDADGTARNEIAYATYDGHMRLPVGIYQVRVAETPISGNGTVYEIPRDELTVSVDAGQHVSIEPKDKVLTFTVAHPESVLDSKINQAKELIKADSQKKDLANKLAKLVAAKRKQAVTALAQHRKNMQPAEMGNEGDEEHDEEDKGENQSDNGGSGGNDSGKSSNQSKPADNGSKQKESPAEQQSENNDQGGQDNPAPSNPGGEQEQQPGGNDASGGGQNQGESQTPSDAGGDTGGSGGSEGGGGESANPPAEQPTGNDQPAE